MNGVSSPTTTGGEDTAITTRRPASGGAGGPRRGGDNNNNGRGNISSSNNNKAWNPVITALAASSALSLQITGFLCDAFVTVQAKPGELLAIVRTSLQEARTQTSLGIFGRGDFYALSAYNNTDTDFMWKLARVFGAVSLAMGGLATLTAWATTVWSPALTPKLLAACPTTGSVWTGIAAAGAMAALLQVPTFLILEAYPCADFTRQQTCHLSLGSYLTMASVVAWIIVTALTQLLDPPEWTRNLEQWRVVLPKNNTAGSTQQDEDDNGDESSTSEDDDVLHQVEEGREISGIPDEEDDDGSQDPIFSPRPRELGSCLVSSHASPNSFWDRLLPWRSTSSAPRKPWQRCVKSKSSSNRHLNKNGATSATAASQSHRVVQRFSSTPSYNRKSNTSNNPAAVHFPESSFLVEEAVESSQDESTITFESATDEDRRRQQQQRSNFRTRSTSTNWTRLAQASSYNHDDNHHESNNDGMGQPQARGLVDPDLQRHRHVIVDQQAQRDQQAPPVASHSHHYNYPIQVLHGSSEWDKPEGIVPAEESLTASSFRTSSSGRDSPITGDESILDKDDAAAKHDSSSSSSSSSSCSSVAESQQGSSALNSKDEEQVKAVAVSGVPIYKDLLAEDEKKLDLNDSVQQQNRHAANLLRLGDSANAGEDADDEHDEDENNHNQLSSSSGALMEDPFFSELPGTSAILNNSSSAGGGGGYNFLDISSNTNMTNNTTNSATPRFLGVGLLSGIAAFRVRGVDSYYPFENDDDEDDEDYELTESSDFSRPPISEVQIFSHGHDDVEDAACGASSIMEDSLLDTIHPVSSSSEHVLLQTWNDLFDFDDPHYATLEDYRQESFAASLEEIVSPIDSDDGRKSTSVVNKDCADADALDDDGQQQRQHPQPQLSVRGKTMEHDENRTRGEIADSSDSSINARDLKRRQMIAAVVRRTNGGGGGVTLRPRRQHRRGRHTSDSVSSATSLLSFTIEEETARDLMEEGGSGDLDGDDHEDYDKKIIDCARRVKQSIPLYRTQSLPYPATNSSVVSDDENGNTRPHDDREASLPRDRLVDAKNQAHVVHSQTEKDQQQQQQQQKDEDHHVDDEEDSIDHQPIPMQRRRSRSLEVGRKKSKRRTASRSLSPDCSLEESSPRNRNKNLWRLDREARSSIHNIPVISLSESSDDDNAADAVGSTTTSSGPNRARLARIQRLQREREQQQQQQQSKDPPGTQDPPLTPIVLMDDTTDASDVVDDTTIETLEPMLSHDQGKLLLHCALTPPRRGSSSRGSSRSAGGNSVASSVDGNESYLNTLEVSLAQLQREDEMEYGPDENSI